MTTVACINDIESHISLLRERLAAHPLYTSSRTPDHLRMFMTSHVFVVWDFMSLLKSLQRTLTSVDFPWTPTRFPASRRFINEIVLGEESDQYKGRPVSNFEIYLEAMTQAGASTAAVERVIGGVERHDGGFESALAHAPFAVRRFVQSTSV